MAIQAVIFDIGNVLINWRPDTFFDRVIGEERRRAFFDAVPVFEMTDRIDRGEGFGSVIDAVAKDYPDWADELTIWHDRWIEIAAPAMDHSVRLLRGLHRAGYPVFALSNFGIEPLEIADREYPFLQEFDRRYISGEMKVIKPDAEIYRSVEADCGVLPEQLFFTDDRADNIATAAARGWQTHLFETSQGLADTLVSAGLLTTEAAQ